MEFDVSLGWIVITDYPIKLPFLCACRDICLPQE